MQGQVAIRPRILQPLRRLRQVNPHLRQQIRPAEVELVAQLKHLHLCPVARQSKRESGRRMTGKILSHLARNHHQPGFFCRHFDLSRQHRLKIRIHVRSIHPLEKTLLLFYWP
jgi:hypothetical protein